jgi:hypothetical protein
VACAECNHQWFEQPATSQKDVSQEQEDVSTPKPTPVEFTDTKAEEKDPAPEGPPIHNLTAHTETEVVRERVASFTTQVMMIPVLAGLLFTGLFFGRNDIVRLLPATAIVYKLLGIATYDLSAFRFQKPEWTISENGNHKTINVAGHVINTSDRLLAAPAVQVTLKGKGMCKPPSWIEQLFNARQNNKNLCTLSKWTFRLREGRLFSGQTSSFNMTYPIGLHQDPQEVLLKFIGTNTE